MAAKQSSKSPNRPPQPRPDDPALSHERILEAAVSLLDEQGIAGLTMRALAERLGSGVMSLYWYVSNKEAVFDRALDHVLAFGASPGTLPETWRDEALAVLEDWRAAMLRHPWSASLLPRRVLGPSILARLERLGGILLKAGVAEADLNAAIWSLWNYVMGATLTRASFERSAPERSEPRAGVAEIQTPYPTIMQSGLLLDEDWDGAFRKGLDFLLDGLVPAQSRS